jgi:hypothetical protein
LGLTALAVDSSVFDVTTTMREAKAQALEVFPRKATQGQQLLARYRRRCNSRGVNIKPQRSYFHVCAGVSLESPDATFHLGPHEVMGDVLYPDELAWARVGFPKVPAFAVLQAMATRLEMLKG